MLILHLGAFLSQILLKSRNPKRKSFFHYCMAKFSPWILIKSFGSLIPKASPPPDCISFQYAGLSNGLQQKLPRVLAYPLRSKGFFGLHFLTSSMLEPHYSLHLVNSVSTMIFVAWQLKPKITSLLNVPLLPVSGIMRAPRLLLALYPTLCPTYFLL